MRSSGSSAPTAPARPPRSRPWRACAGPTEGRSASSASTPSATPLRCASGSAPSSRRRGLPDKLRVGEAVDLFASFYPSPRDPGELLEALGLSDRLDDPYRKLSGGQKQRLSIALALIGDPEIAVLDELTTGLDPHARRDVWRLITGLRDRGATVLLVTHAMDEAERLCDRVALFDRGRVVAVDTPVAVAGSVRTERATLEDAFVALTGSGPEED